MSDDYSFDPPKSLRVKPDWRGNAILAACIAIPILGCCLAVYFKDMSWLVLLAPLFVFMEGAFVLIAIALLIVSYLVG